MPEDVTDGPTSPSSSPVPTTTSFQGVVQHSRRGIELASSTRVRARTDTLEDRIHQLELLADGFKEKVQGVAKEYNLLSRELSQYSEEFEGLETDYFDALAALEEEKFTVRDYLGKLRHAEIEISILWDSLPEGYAEALLGHSQAKTYDPIFERRA
ncbi:hypothetical protein FA13DRAFT_1800108 [Coprinellus micaceus]|uniref:Uncharacterized protein n=1 Tax=Coprinellus micaceus TaxID=71717 RepID=A0A4Y7SH36_COPMI|nr:hypothetical protein FA13DRAFT_1800108 [Coprinellus micaceus]